MWNLSYKSIFCDLLLTSEYKQISSFVCLFLLNVYLSFERYKTFWVSLCVAVERVLGAGVDKAPSLGGSLDTRPRVRHAPASSSTPHQHSVGSVDGVGDRLTLSDATYTCLRKLAFIGITPLHLPFSNSACSFCWCSFTVQWRWHR